MERSPIGRGTHLESERGCKSSDGFESLPFRCPTWKVNRKWVLHWLLTRPPSPTERGSTPLPSAVAVIPAWRRWSARLSEEQEEVVRFDSPGLLMVALV